MTIALAPSTQTAAPHQLGFTPEQIVARRRTLGASEIPAVAGLSKYRTPMHVYLEKRGLIEPDPPSQYTEWGHRMEPLIADKYADTFGAMLERSETIVSAAEPWMSCTPDRFVRLVEGEQFHRHGLECKNRSQHVAAEWGESGSDLVPNDVAAQCHWSMIVTGIPRWDVAVLLGGNDFRWYALHRDEQIAAYLQEVGRDFWFNYLEKGIVPPITDGGEATHRYLAKRFKSHTEVLLPATAEHDALVQNLIDIRATIAAFDAEGSKVEAQLKAAIGEAAGIQGDGYRVTWKAPKTGAVSWKSVATDLARHFGAPADLVNTLAAEHTGEPSRRFLLTTTKAS